jgi:UDP-glucose 4-epimerase
MTILRLGNVYGPRQNGSSGAGVVAIFASQMIRDGDVEIRGSGNQKRDFVFVSDCARANCAVIEQGVSGVFNIGSGIGVSVYRIFEALRDLLDYRQSPRYISRNEGEVHRIWLDNQQARKALGWTANVDLQEGLQRTLRHFEIQTS